MKKYFFIEEIVPFLIILLLIFVESKIKLYFDLSADVYLSLMAAPTAILYFPLVKVFEKKVVPYLKSKRFC